MKNGLAVMSKEELVTLRDEQVINQKISEDDRNKRVDLIDEFLKKKGKK